MKLDATVPYASTGFVNPLIEAYYNHNQPLSSFYKYAPSLEGLIQASESRDFSPHKRQILHQVLQQQHQSLSLHESQKNNLKAILDENSRTITTGHQLCLFTGPLYTIYKISSIIKLSKTLSEQHPSHHYIPIYWLASEDHDFDEVNHAHIYGKKLIWNHPKGDAVGRMNLEDLQPVLQALKEVLGNSPSAIEILKLINSAYSEKHNLEQATRILIHELFKNHGLLILDGDNPMLKKEFVPIIKKELEDEDYFHIVNRTSEQLVNIGYKKQVNPREINLFYLHNGFRQRIVKKDRGFVVDTSGTTLTPEELIDILEQHPERFSPNVIMRPLYQESILPNIAYVGGGGELTYWFQLKQGFEHFNIPFPVLLLRNSATLIDVNSLKKLTKLQLNTSSIFQNEEDLIKKFVQEHTSENLSLAEETKILEDIYNRIIEKTNAIDQSIRPFAEGEKKKMMKSLTSIEKKMIQAEKRKQETSLKQISGLKKKFFPNGGLQERNNNILQYLISEGNQIIDTFIDTFDPLSTDMYIFQLGGK